MALNDLLIGDLGMTHLITLDYKGAEEDGVTTETPTKVNGGNYTWVEEPCCEGFTYALKSNDSTSYEDRENGASFDNAADINTDVPNTYGATGKTLGIWCRFSQNITPSCIFEEGAYVNNFAFFVGIGKAITWQAADDGQPFLIAQSNLQAQVNRNYFLTGTWEYQRNGYNAVDFYINGVLQETVQLNGTDVFPNHSGDIVIGNTDDDLKSYNEGTIKSAIRETWANLWFIKNHEIWGEDILRDIFERTTLAEVTLEADTVENQQIALDNLIGTVYEDKNCAIRIVQATDATDYTLLLDNIKFKRVDELRDIHIQFVGTGELHIENCNGSNAYELSVPAEVERVNDTLQGGGSITKTDNSIRLKDDTDYINHIVDGNIWIDCDEDVVIKMSDVRCYGKVYNYNPNTKVTIIATSCQLDANDPGTDNGQVDIQAAGTLTITGLVDNTEVRLYTEDLNEEIYAIESSSGDVVIDYQGNYDNAVLIIYNKDYAPIRLTVQLDGTNATLPIKQIPDSAYINP